MQASHELRPSKMANEPSFDLFISGDLQSISIGVIATEKELFKYTCFKIEVKSPSFPTFYSYRRYNEFYALYKALKIRYENLDFPPFPPKIQIFNKVETRKASFHLLLNKVLEVAIKHYQAQKTLTLLKTLYAFLTKNISGIKPKISTTPVTNNVVDNENEKEKVVNVVNNAFENKKTSFTNDDSEGEEDISAVENFSNILLNNSKEEENTTEKLKKINDIDNQKKSLENDEKLSKKDSIKKVIENDDRLAKKDSNIIKKNDDKIDKLKTIDDNLNKKETMVESTNTNVVLERKSRNDKKKTEIVVETPVSKKDEKILQQADIKEDSKYQPTNLKNKLINYTNCKIKNLIGNLANVKNEIMTKNKDKVLEEGLKRIINDNEFDYLNFYENEIPNFGGNIWVKFKNERKWTILYGKLQDSNLLLFPSILENNFIVLISLYGANIEIIEYYEDLQYIEIYHNYDRDKTLISIEPPKNDFNISNSMTSSSPKASCKEIKIQLLKWFKQMKLSSEKILNLEFEQYKFRPIGKTFISIIEVKNLKGITQNTTVFVKIKHTPYVFKTKKVLGSENPKWKQSFLMPVSDHFFSIKFEVISSMNDGLFTEHQKEELYGTCEILIADFMSKYTHSEKHIELPIEITEQRKKKMEKNVKGGDINSENGGINNDAFLVINMKNLSHLKSWFAKEHPNYMEGMYINKEEVNKRELKMGFGRAKRIWANCALQINDINEIFRFKYPKLSYICLFISIFIVLTADMNNILSYLTITIIILIIFNIPELSFRKDNFLYKHIVGFDNLNKEYVFPTIETITQQESRKFKDIERLRLKMKDKESILTKYRAMKKSIAKVQIIITSICNFLEKIKNLLLWKDPQRTTYFLVLMFILYVFVSRLPIRFFLLLGVLDKFYCGKNFYKKTYHYNGLVASKVIRYIVAKYYQENLKAFDEDLEWPQNIHFGSFQKKLIEQLTLLLRLDISEGILTKAKKPSDLIKMISTTSVLLKVDIQQNDLTLKHILKKIKRRKTSSIIIKKIMNFIFNIPSDYYRVMHRQELKL